MKRVLSSPDPNELTDNSTHASKCRISHNTHQSSHYLGRPSKRRRSDTPPLTQETLESHKCVAEPKSLEEWIARRAQSIKQWAYTCESGDELEMPPPSMPSVTASRGSRRRITKLVQRQRSRSPVKKADSPQYRAMNMADANVFVDHFPDVPTEIEEQLGRIFSRTTWTDNEQKAIEELTKQYYEESRVLAKKCAGENEWKSQLYLGLLQPLNRLEPEILMLSASEKPWLSELKPTSPSPYDFIPTPAPQQASTQSSRSTNTNLPTPRTQPTTSLLANTPIFSVPSTASSDVSSENPNGLLTPKPDITLGLAHTSFTPLQRTVLMLLQDNCRVFSEPHQAQIGLRFPFLVVESKGGAAGGNMIGAQNQAAVDGACALNILSDLQSAVEHITSRPDYVQYTKGSITKEQEGNRLPPLLFSVTTEGPLHEIWVHCRVGEAYHMTCHRAWRTTRHEDTKEFVQTLAKIVDWGKKRFRESVLMALKRIEGPVLGGILGSLDEGSTMDQ